MDQSFRCDSSYKHNGVKLTSVKQENGKTLAYIEYDVEEFITVSSAPRLRPQDSATTLHFTFTAEAIFSITDGRRVHDGALAIKTKGFAVPSQLQHFALIPPQ